MPAVASTSTRRLQPARFDIAQPPQIRDRDAGGVSEVVGQPAEFLRLGAWLTMLLVHLLQSMVPLVNH